MGQFIIGMLTGIFLLIFRGFTICTLWGWFIYEQFSLPALTMPTAMGMSLLMGVIVQRQFFFKRDIDEIKNSDSAEGLYVTVFNAIKMVCLFIWRLEK